MSKRPDSQKYLIVTGKICPYCFGRSEFVDSEVIYGKSYGMIYHCTECDAYCGVHKGSDKSLGRLANKELRELKKEAHAWFDGLWKAKIKRGTDRKTSRSKAYQWLSEQLNTKPAYTHIGMFDVDQCKLVIAICKKYYRK